MLGIRVDSVPSGMSNWPLLTGNTAPALFKDGTAATDAVAASFTVAELKPKRLSAEMELSHELIGSVLGVENEFRNNLMAALKAQMNDLVLNGAAPNAQKPHLIEGFITRLAENNDSAIADAARYGRLHAAAVDGIHAENEREVMGVIGVASYTHAAGVYIAGSGKSGSQLLAERSGGCMASSYIPAKNGNHQQAILHAAGPNGGGAMRGDSVAAVWQSAGLEIVRDLYTHASQGIVLTGIMLWDCRTALRADAYERVGIQIS